MVAYPRLFGVLLVFLMTISNAYVSAHSVEHMDSSSLECQICKYPNQSELVCPNTDLQITNALGVSLVATVIPVAPYFLDPPSSYFQRAPPSRS